LLRKGAAEAVTVLAFRRDNYAGEIELTAEGLPPGVHAAPAVIGPGKNSALLVLAADENAAEWSGVFRIVGKGRVGDKELIRTARAGTIVWPGQQNGPPGVARMAANLALAVGAESAQFTASADGGPKWEAARGGKLQIPIKITCRSGFADKLTLNPLDLPPNVQAGNVTINADQTEGKLALSVGNTAPLGTFTFYLRADAKLSNRRDAKQSGEDAKSRNIDVFVPVSITLKITEKPEPQKKK
jgi:hypothetical protein